MVKKKEVYAVTRGGYSDYHVHGLFSTREKANEYLAKCRAAYAATSNEDEFIGVPYDFNDIEIYELDSPLKECIYNRWYVGLMLDDGSLEGGRKPSKDRIWGIPQSSVYICENVPMHGGRGVVRAESHKSEEHAIKLAVEKRQEWLRLGGKK